MRIVAVDVLPFAIPLRTPLATARRTITTRAGFVVRLRTDSGACGIGEATPHPHAAAAAREALGTELLASVRWLAGAAVAHADELIDAAGTVSGPAAMGIDMALHDLLARTRGISVAELLCGERAPVALSALLDGDVVRAARAAAAAGFTAGKLKMSGDPAADVARARAVRSAAPGLSLRLDANGAWDAQQAVAVAHALDARGIAWLEQPTPAGDLATLARVRHAVAALGHRVAADEAVTGADAVRRIVELAAADVVVLKLAQVGGLRRALAAARAARRAGLAVAVTTGLETSLGTAAALQLAAVLATGGAPGRLVPAGLATTELLAGDVVAPPIVAAAVLRPAGPGLGVTLAASMSFGVGAARDRGVAWSSPTG